ncbi:hypothetical protein A8V01_20880 [Novosphingobium guangzhouense]|uniref:Uncharacterized protein n=1 Tax=Novosphingobium guangzhouense TaxID=1850347 RepID=A0A2K2FZY3_9SPHN|nr:hypothetical protein A8V01_20880 [Novosphingobium guangzhouense]
MLCGCSTTTYNPDLPTGAAAYDTIPAIVPAPTTYAIRAKDVLTLRVFGEPEVSQDELRVDDAGLIQVPLIGTVKAAGRDAQEIGSEITGKLAQSYLRNPQVAVSVKQATPSFVSVEGEVEKPGVYEIDGRSTLLSAIARAESPTASAKLTEVVVFRTIDQKSMVARFDLKRIRTGIDPDPMILDGDVVMVGYSTTRGFWQDLLKTAPLLNAFSLAATR